jgi:DNA-binding MarR family transcriptional regulator
VTVGELAERLQVAHHSAVGLVDRLEHEKYVRRANSAEDRRRVWISLTARGEKVLARLSQAHTAELRRIGPDVASLLSRLCDPLPPP